MTITEGPSHYLPDDDPIVIEMFKVDAGIDEPTHAAPRSQACDPDDDPAVRDFFGMGMEDVQSILPRDVKETPSETTVRETNRQIVILHQLLLHLHDQKMSDSIE